LIEDGNADDVSLDDLKVAFATRDHDDELGSPWSFVMYVDERAEPARHDALERIYTGQLGGDALTHFPWAWKNAERIAVRPVEIEVSHEPRRSGCESATTSPSASATRRPGLRPSRA